MQGLAAVQQPSQKAHPDVARAPITVDWELSFSRAQTRLALTYWTSLCAGRKMPRRSELRPQAMRSFLKHVNLVDVQVRESARLDYVFSLQGQHALEVVGPVSNRSFDDVLPAHVAQRWRTCLDVAYRAAKPVRFASRILANGKLWLDSESLMAPLGDEAKGVDTIFLVLASWPAPAERALPAAF